jgi:hypothetical protein
MEKIAVFSFGVVFVIVLLVLTVFISDPTPTQHETFKIVLALAAAGIGSIIPGFIQIEGTFNNFALRAGGALALFLVVYFLTPAVPVTPIKTQQSINGNYGTQIEKNNGVLNINHKTNDTIKIKK